MDSKLFAACGVAALLLVGSVGAVATGLGPAPTTDQNAGDAAFSTDSTPASDSADGATASDSDDTTGSTSASDPGDTADSAGSSDGGDATMDARPFSVVPEAIENCGRTCRDVTSTVTNQQDSTARDVTVSTRIYAGREASGDPVWEGAADVGTLEASDSHTVTKRIELGFGGALSVKRANGWLTIQTTVESADRSVTMTERRNVT